SHGISACGTMRPRGIPGEHGRRGQGVAGLDPSATSSARNGGDMVHRVFVSLALAATVGSVAVVPHALAQARTDIVIGLVLEPPVLDPTANAAAAVDEVVYANVF